jgi:iron donor protein CyaY
MTSESEFVGVTDRTLAAIGDALDAAVAESDAEIDWTQNDGILEIECADGSKLIVNRHLPNREIWVAAKPEAFISPRSAGSGATRSVTSLAGADAASSRPGRNRAHATPSSPRCNRVATSETVAARRYASSNAVHSPSARRTAAWPETGFRPAPRTVWVLSPPGGRLRAAA